MSERDYSTEARKYDDPSISQVGSVTSSGSAPPPGSQALGVVSFKPILPEPAPDKKRTFVQKVGRWLKYGPVD